MILCISGLCKRWSRTCIAGGSWAIGNMKTKELTFTMRILILGLALAIPVLLVAQQPVSTNRTASAAALDAEPAPGGVAPSAYPPLTAEQKASRRMKRLIEPVNLLSAAFGAGFDQLRNDPKPWGQGAEGYARRVGSAEGFAVSDGMIGLGCDIAFHLDPRYHRKPEARIGGRVWNAVSQTFLAYNDSGGRTVNVSEIAGNFGAGFVSNTWEPRGYNSTGDALTRGALGLAYHTGKNVVRELLPSLASKH
jgi:hypothetical protein